MGLAISSNFEQRTKRTHENGKIPEKTAQGLKRKKMATLKECIRLLSNERVVPTAEQVILVIG
jgi:hypothetical protein